MTRRITRNPLSERCSIEHFVFRGFGRNLLKHGLATLALAVFGGTALAQTSGGPCPLPGCLTYSDGDLFLNFRATDGTVGYMVNLDQPDQFVNAVPGSILQVNTGNILPDLATAFGADWYTRLDPNTGNKSVLLAVVGARQIGASGDPMNTLYSSNPSLDLWPRRPDTAQSFTATLIAAVGNTFASGVPTPNNPHGKVYSCAQVGYLCSGGTSFGVWKPTNEGVPDANLFLDRIPPGSGPSNVLGYFALNKSGELTFHAADWTRQTSNGESALAWAVYGSSRERPTSKETK